MKVALIVCALSLVSAKIYFKEEFGAGWEDRWMVSEHDESYGKLVASAGEFFDDEARDTGMKTSEDARFYSVSSMLSESFSNKDTDLVIQFSVKHEQKIDCGGGYLKIMPSTIDQKDFHGDTVYNVMFGPDICGATKRTHVIFNYNDDNHLRRSDVKCESDELTHLYTLIVKPDQSYDVQIDQKSVASGNLVDDFDFLAPKEIEDPATSKPTDWVDQAMIVDPTETKPDGYDEIAEFVVDPEAEKPEDWDDEDDGEWEAPTIENPEYKGEWTPAMIENPDYVGEWVHPLVANPDYQEDDQIYAFSDFGAVGLDIWQVKSGTIFDNIIITDSIEEAEEFAAATWALQRPVEKKLAEEDRETKKAEADEERAVRDAEIKAMEDEASESEEVIAAHPHDDL